MLAPLAITVMKIECGIGKIPCGHAGSWCMGANHCMVTDGQASLHFDKPSAPKLFDFGVAAPVVDKLSSPAVLLPGFNSFLNIAIATHTNYHSTSCG